MGYLETFTGSILIIFGSGLLYLNTRYKEAKSKIKEILASNKSNFFIIFYSIFSKIKSNKIKQTEKIIRNPINGNPKPVCPRNIIITAIRVHV